VCLFVASFTFERRDLPGREKLPTSPAVLALINAGPKSAEGRAVRLEVRSKKDLAEVEALVSLEMAAG
jgi:hypothetical protein